MADTIGTIKYDFMIDTSGASKGVSDAKKAAKEVAKSAEASASQTENKFAGAFSKIAGVAGNAAKKTAQALWKITKEAVKVGTAMTSAMTVASVKMYADYEQNIGGIETLFKDASSTVEQYAENAFKTAGMSANTYMETVTSFSARLLQGLGGDTQKAAEISNMAVTDMADNANKMGTSMEAIQNAYQGFAKQNYTMLDNLKLGYGGTASEMARLINDSGVLGDTMQVTAQTVNDVSFDKMIEAIHKVQDNMGITGTTAKEAASTISGSFGMMRAAWDNLLTFMGSGKGNLDEILQNLMESVKTFASNLLPVVETILINVANAINELAPLLIEKLPAVIGAIIPPLLTAVVSIVQAIIASLPGLINSLVNAMVGLAPTIVNAIIETTPLLFNGLLQVTQNIANLIPELLPLIVQMVSDLAQMLTSPENLNAIFDAAIALLNGLIEAIPDTIVSLINNLPKIINNIVNFLLNPSNIKKIIKAGVQLFLGLVKAVPQILGALIGAFGSLFGNLWNSVTGLFSSFAANFGNTIGNIFRGAINGVISFIENFINLPIQTINGFIGVLNGVLGAVGASIGYIPTISLPRLYTGGVVEGRGQGRIIVAGDGGEDEWVVPESKMGSLLEQLEQRGAGGGNVTINVTGTFATSASEQRKVAEQIYQRLQELDRARFGGATV